MHLRPQIAKARGGGRSYITDDEDLPHNQDLF